MILHKWEELPKDMQTEQVRKYYDSLRDKKCALIFKRVFDIVLSMVLLLILAPVYLILAIAIKLDSKGPVLFRQIRITKYGKQFRIHKFRSMTDGADKGNAITAKNDSRITRVGGYIRKYRLDELSQLVDILQGNMTFVGTRPEVPKYVALYTPEMRATLLLPAGVTSKASIFFKNEDQLLSGAVNVDETYVNEVLPIKMRYNLKAVEHFSVTHEMKIMIMTVLAVLGKDFHENKQEK